MNTSDLSFGEFVAKSRNDVRKKPGLSDQERQVLLSLLDMTESFYGTFERGAVLDEHGGREPPLDRAESAELMMFAMSLAKERTGDRCAPMEVEIQGPRKIALSIVAIAPCLERSNQTYIAMTSADAARGRAMQSLNKTEPPIDFITWAEVDPVRLRNHGIIAEGDLATTPAGQREMIERKLAELRRAPGVNLMVLVAQKSSRHVRQAAMPQASNSGCGFILGVLVLSAAVANWIVA